MDKPSQLLSLYTQILKSKITRHAVYGIIISIFAILAATSLSCFMLYDNITLAGMLNAQKSNPVLWIVDLMPFMFAVWGQYTGMKMAYEMGALVIDQTEEFRTKQSILENTVSREATHDALTDLPNRILFKDRVEHAIKNATRHESLFSIFVLDLDRFKEINNTLGHFSGDLLLKQVALRLTGVVRDSDTLARLGGDEFAMLFPAINKTEDIKIIANKILTAFSPAFALENLNIDVDVSIGAVVFPDHGEDADTLLQRVDVAMYVAKQEKIGFAAYTPEMDKHSPFRLTLMSELKKAINEDHLRLFFQPKINSGQNRITGAESLVRWSHEEHGLILPDEFINLAERTGFITHLSRWVIKHALQQILVWNKSGIDLKISLNLSTKDLSDPALPDILVGLLASYNVPPESLIFEITETSIMVDPNRSLEIISRIHDMGINFSIDDFGTGYSSLSYLTKLPVDEIKIDKSFVTDMLQNENDLIIVRTTIDMAHNLGLKVIAEGAETKEVYDRLKSLGCDEVQGYYISRPLPAKEFENWLKSSEWADAKKEPGNGTRRIQA
jgi:diguanylate cyclase